MKYLRFFFTGTLSAFGALFLELALEVILSPAPIVHSALPTSVTPLLLSVIIIEEGIKYITLKKSFQSLSSKFIFPSLAFALGFGLTESAFVFFSAPVFSYYFMIGILVLHLITVSWASWFLKNYSSFNSRFISLITLAIMIIIHLGYNGLIIYNFSIGIIYAYLIIFSIILLPVSRLPRAAS